MCHSIGQQLAVYTFTNNCKEPHVLSNDPINCKNKIKNVVCIAVHFIPAVVVQRPAIINTHQQNDVIIMM